TGGLAYRNRLAASEGPRAGATGRQEHKCEPRGEEGAQIVHGGKGSLLLALRHPARSGHRRSKVLGRAGYGTRRRSSGIGGAGGLQRARVLPPPASSRPPFDCGLESFRFKVLFHILICVSTFTLYGATNRMAQATRVVATSAWLLTDHPGDSGGRLVELAAGQIASRLPGSGSRVAAGEGAFHPSHAIRSSDVKSNHAANRQAQTPWSRAVK